VKLTDEDRERLVDVTVIASVSGGKDSAAMSLWLTEQGIDHRRVFADTGWEHPDTYDYLRGPLTEALGPIEEVAGKRPFAELVRHKTMFPSRRRRFCTQELKVRPLARYVRQFDDAVNAVGIRAQESQARSQLPRWEYSKDFQADVWRPLIDWSEADVIAIHQRHGLAPNPLYLRGAERVGCWPCIFSRKREIALVASLTPERIEEIARLEQEIGDIAEQRTATDGVHRNRPTFFHPRGHAPERKDFVPIEAVVAWARTARGGKQLLLLDTEPAGCVRWGLCESHPEGR
jgi:3'-phosphoadenosine 5'-phosphosulfate sulfotransferase (PAPS reductase)/FAD synthetase